MLTWQGACMGLEHPHQILSNLNILGECMPLVWCFSTKPVMASCTGRLTHSTYCCRELQHSLREVTATAEEESRLRRQLEISLAEQQQHAQAVEAELRRARKAEDGSHDDVIRALRSELRSQGAEIAQARKIQSRVKWGVLHPHSVSLIEGSCRSEHRLLGEFCRSLGVMQEKLQAAEARAARAENEQAASLELQSRISTLEMQLQAWEASANDLGIDRPEELFAKLQELRNECLAAANSRGDTEVELRKSQGSLLWQPLGVLCYMTVGWLILGFLARLQRSRPSVAEELKAARNSTVELQATLHSVQGANAELAALAARFERKVSLLTREREGLQKMLASYSAEEAIPTNNAGAVRLAGILGRPNAIAAEVAARNLADK